MMRYLLFKCMILYLSQSNIEHILGLKTQVKMFLKLILLVQNCGCDDENKRQEELKYNKDFPQGDP